MWRRVWALTRAWVGFVVYIVPAVLRYRRRRNGEDLRRNIERAGPSFVKIAQWISQRPDIAGQDLCDALEPLTDRYPTHAWAITESLLRRELLPDMAESLLEHINTIPVGSGSVAQVYRSTMVTNEGKRVDVAIKVLHPDIRDSLWAGSRVLATVSWMFSIPLDWSGFQKSVMRQTDLRYEAANLETFTHNFHHLDFVVFPTMYLVTPSILVESYEEGEPWELFGQHNPQFHDECVILRMACFWKMGFHDNFLHSDMHRGNLLFRVRDMSLQVVFLDAGVVSTVEDVGLLKDFLYILFAFRMEGMARIMMRVNLNPHADLFGFLVDVTNYRQVLRNRGVLTFDIATYLRKRHNRVVNKWFGSNENVDNNVEVDSLDSLDNMKAEYQQAGPVASQMDQFRNGDETDLLSTVAYKHPWIRNLEYEEKPFMEIPGPEFQQMFQHVTAAMKRHGLVVDGDVLMLLFGFLLSESYALKRPTPSLLMDAMFYMKERDMVDIDEWLDVPWEWLLLVKRILKNNHDATVLRATSSPLQQAEIPDSILDNRYNQGRPSIQAISIDAMLKWDMIMNTTNTTTTTTTPLL